MSRLPTFNQKPDTVFTLHSTENTLIDFSVDDIQIKPWADYNTKNLDKQASHILETEQIAVKNCLEQLCDSMNHEPKLSEDCPQIPGLKIDLLYHQKYALNWFLHREKCKPSGGLLGM